MASIASFSWPHHANTRRSEQSEPTTAPDNRLLMISIGIAAAATGIIIISTIFFFALKYRKARAAKTQSKDTEAVAETIELKDNDLSAYVSDVYRGGDIGDGRCARISSELPVHFARVVKDDGELGLVEVDLSSEKVKG